MQKSLDSLVGEVAGYLHKDDPIRAGQATADLLGLGQRVTSLPLAFTALNSLLHWLLNHNRYDLAAKLLWSEQQFSSEPYATKLVWDTVQGSSSYLLMGAASMSKSFSGGVWHLLDWIRDPEYTTVKLVGPSEQHLEENLFSHLVRMHRESKIPLPGQIGELFIGLDPRDRRSSISGVVIPPGRRGGRLQGSKRTPRKESHPIFGTMSRMRIFLDEFEKIPPGVWKDVDNIFSNVDADVEGFKIGGAFNPEDSNGPCGVRCEPVGGWDRVDKDKDDRWTSRRGWDVCRLNALKSENVKQRKKIFPGLQTHEGVEKIVKNAGGWNAPSVYTMIYALFPPSGLTSTVFSNESLTGVKKEFIWLTKPEPCGGVDLALEGGDTAFFAAGRVGIATGYRTLDGKTVEFKNANGQNETRPACQLDSLFELPKASSVPMAAAVKKFAGTLGIKPGYLMLDRTGNGAGVHDILQTSWSAEVRGINYSESATQTRILDEDTKTAYDEYDRVLTELWFGLKKWNEVGGFAIGHFVDTDQLYLELTDRQYFAGDKSKKTRVESKKDYKARHGDKSPDRADAVTLLLFGARMASSYLPGATSSGQGEPEDDDGERPRGHVSESEKLDSLDD